MSQAAAQPPALAEAKDPFKRLREPFPPDAINKLPRNVQDGPKSNCKVCGGYHGPTNLHLDYVGHAAVTDRLLEVDPTWTWEPFQLDEQGMPVFILDQGGHPVGFWIRLTVLGVTRPGYGSCAPGKSDAVKELIGDALRNASMRFGVALDLWRKDVVGTDHGGDRESRAAPSAPGSPNSSRPAAPSSRQPKPASAAQLGAIAKIASKLGWDDDRRHAEMSKLTGRKISSGKDLTSPEASKAIQTWGEIQTLTQAPEGPENGQEAPENEPESQEPIVRCEHVSEDGQQCVLLKGHWIDHNFDPESEYSLLKEQERGPVAVNVRPIE